MKNLSLNYFINKNINNANKINKEKEKDIEEDENLKIGDINNENANRIDELEKKLSIKQMNLNISNKKAELYEKKYEQIVILNNIKK